LEHSNVPVHQREGCHLQVVFTAGHGAASAIAAVALLLILYAA
jgi:hypothetical protein